MLFNDYSSVIVQFGQVEPHGVTKPRQDSHLSSFFGMRNGMESMYPLEKAEGTPGVPVPLVGNHCPWPPVHPLMPVRRMWNIEQWRV